MCNTSLIVKFISIYVSTLAKRRISVLLSFLLFTIGFTPGYSQQVFNVQTQVSVAVDIGSTPNTPSSYNWSEKSSTVQGIDINVIPTEINKIFVQENNAKFAFHTNPTTNLIFDLAVKWSPSGSYQQYYNGGGTTFVGQLTPPASLYSGSQPKRITVRWIGFGSEVKYRQYDVYTVPQSAKYFEDNYGNSITLWENNPSSQRPPLVISEGYDAYNNTFSETYYALGSGLFGSALNKGFKVYFVNYKYNTQNMQNTAAIYNSAIQYISSLNSNSDVHAIGVSMGGVIARYALAKAEDDGSPLPVEKFISIDSPQQGANISQSLQNFVKFPPGCSSGPDDFAKHGLDNPAAKQLLNYNAYGTQSAAFYNELNSLNNNTGYPQLTENIGVAFSNNSPNPNSGVWLNIQYSGFLGSGVCGVDNDITLVSTDQVPGSFFPLDAFSPDPKPIFFGWFNATRTSDPTFIPYSSALDIIGSESKFDVCFEASAGNYYYHDQFPPELIAPVFEAILPEHELTISAEYLELGSGGSVLINGTTYPLPHTVQVKEDQPLTIEALPISLNVNGKQLTYNLAHWSDGSSENPRTITLQQDGTLEAIYKAAMASNESGVLNSNNQRKIVRDANTNHLVYESEGEIWYTSSYGLSGSWAPEARISRGNGLAANPSIDVVSGTPVVVWQEVAGLSEIWMGRKISGTWETELVDGFFSSQEVYPVVAASPGSYHAIVYRDFNTNKLAVRMYDVVYNNGFGQIVNVPNTNSNSKYPTLTRDTYGKVHLAWAESDKVYYSRLTYSTDSKHDESFSWEISKEEVSSGATGITDHDRPSITTDYGRRANISWQGFSQPLITDVVMHRRRGNSGEGAWGPITVFSGAELGHFSPSITGFPNSSSSSNTLHIVWQREDEVLRKAFYNGTSWNQTALGGSGYRPNISANTGSSLEYKIVYRELQSGAPFRFLTLPTATEKLPGEIQVAQVRRGILQAGATDIFTGLSDLQLNGSTLLLHPLQSVKQLQGIGYFEKGMRSENFSASSGDILNFDFSARYATELREESTHNAIGFAVLLINANNGEVVQLLERVALDTENEPGVKTSGKSIKVTVNARSEVFLAVRPLMQGEMTVDVTFMDEFQEKSGTDAAKPVQSGDGIAELPQKFTLQQNYPNPFNPSTRISYQLPEDGKILLEVFNALGQRVAVLEQGIKPAGSHSVDWDAASFSSGVYLYRIEFSGRVLTRKMLLMR